MMPGFFLFIFYLFFVTDSTQGPLIAKDVILHNTLITCFVYLEDKDKDKLLFITAKSIVN